MSVKSACRLLRSARVLGQRPQADKIEKGRGERGRDRDTHRDRDRKRYGERIRCTERDRNRDRQTDRQRQRDSERWVEIDR